MQTSWVAASLLIAFFVFVTVRGELPEYIAVLTGTDAGSQTHTAPDFTNVKDKLGF